MSILERTSLSCWEEVMVSNELVLVVFWFVRGERERRELARKRFLPVRQSKSDSKMGWVNSWGAWYRGRFVAAWLNKKALSQIGARQRALKRDGKDFAQKSSLKFANQGNQGRSSIQNLANENFKLKCVIYFSSRKISIQVCEPTSGRVLISRASRDETRFFQFLVNVNQERGK